MKKPDLKIKLLIILAFIYAIIKMVFSINNMLNTFIWLLIFMFGYIFHISNYNRFENDKNKYLTIGITLVIILIIYFLLGLLFGYTHNALYSKSTGFFINVFNYIIIIFFQEYLRALFIKYSGNKKSILVLITLIFIVNELNITTINFYNIFTGLFSTYIPIILKNILLTYITIKIGYKNAILYRVIIIIFNVFLPILPNTNWMINGIIQILIPIITYFILDYEIKIEENNIKLEDIKKNNPISYIPYFIIISIMFLFIIGVFDYKITAIMSNSMYPLFERGDVVITKNIDDINEIKVGDIIKFKRDNEFIIHRVNKISKKNNKIVFITKGDNNLSVDENLVYEEDIESVYIFKIKYIGYLSVWISEALKN